jgi:hypothetical protein
MGAADGLQARDAMQPAAAPRSLDGRKTLEDDEAARAA